MTLQRFFASAGVSLPMVIVLGAPMGAVDRVSGVITRTYVIVEDTELAGNVTCAVDSGPCFSFGAPGVELKLNGFTMTGKADPVTGCGGALDPNRVGAFSGETGVTTNGQPRVSVRGPGLIERFRLHGVLVTGSTGARVELLTTATNCGSGILVHATAFETLIQDNVSVRNGSTLPGFTCGGICLIGHNNRVRRNEVNGNGYAEPADDFGIGAIGTASGNVIELNSVVGNTNGIFLGAGTRQTLVRQNTILGNPAIQIGNTHPSAQGVDIRSLAPAGAVTFERNLCVTSVNAPCPDVSGTGWRPQQLP